MFLNFVVKAQCSAKLYIVVFEAYIINPTTSVKLPSGVSLGSHHLPDCLLDRIILKIGCYSVGLTIIVLLDMWYRYAPLLQCCLEALTPTPVTCH